MSLNTARHSRSNLTAGAAFTLSAYAEGLEAAALAAGGGGGGRAGAATWAAQGGKVASLGLEMCACGGGGGGGGSTASAAAADALPALAHSPAHLRCTVISELLPERGGAGALRGHALLLARIDEAFVDLRYWRDGKVFGASGDLPRLLAFAGSGSFVRMELSACPPPPDVGGKGAREVIEE